MKKLLLIIIAIIVLNGCGCAKTPDPMNEMEMPTTSPPILHPDTPPPVN